MLPLSAVVTGLSLASGWFFPACSVLPWGRGPPSSLARSGEMEGIDNKCSGEQLLLPQPSAPAGLTASLGPRQQPSLLSSGRSWARRWCRGRLPPRPSELSLLQGPRTFLE